MITGQNSALKGFALFFWLILTILAFVSSNFSNSFNFFAVGALAILNVLLIINFLKKFTKND